MSAQVLVVDGDRFHARVLRAQLLSIGLESCHALTGAEAIDFAYGQRPRLLLIALDLGPGLDALATAASIRARVDAAEIFVARPATPATLRRHATCKDACMLERPFGVDHLLAAIVATCPTLLPPLLAAQASSSRPHHA